MSRKWPMNEKYDYTNESILCKHCGNQTIMRMVSRGIYIKEIKDDPIDEQLRYEVVHFSKGQRKKQDLLFLPSFF